MLSVIIPTCNRNDLLSKCLALLAPENQTIDFNLYEVIVTDDSKMNCAKVLVNEQFNWVKWVEGPKRGPAANRNNGANYAKGNWLIFIDDDCLPDKKILKQYQQFIEENPDTQAVEGAIFPDNWKLLNKDMAECPINIEGGYFWSANIGIKRSLFERIKGFDEDFKIAAHEDQLIFLKIKKITPVSFVSSAIVIHPVRFTSLTKKIMTSQKSLKNWLTYEYKMSNSIIHIFKKGFFSQLFALKKNASSFKIKSCIFNLYTLLIGLPILFIKNLMYNAPKI